MFRFGVRRASAAFLVEKDAKLRLRGALQGGARAHVRSQANEQRPSLVPTRRMTTPNHLSGLLPEDLALFLRDKGVSVSDGEARRIVAHAIAKGEDGFPGKRPVKGLVEEAVDKLVDRGPLEIIERATDSRTVS